MEHPPRYHSRHFLESTRSMLAFNSTAAFQSRAALRDPSLFLWGSRTRNFFYDAYEEDEGETNPRWYHHLPPKPTVSDRLLFPFYSFQAWMRLLCDNYDWKFVAMIVCGQHLLKGLLAGGGTQGLLVVEGLIYMKLQVGASAKVTFQSISQSAWGLKPLYALISDAFSIGGYRRTPWILLTSLLATLAYVTLVFHSTFISGAMVCLCFFCVKLQLSWTDLMVEATYTEKMRSCPRYSTDIVSFAWSGIGLFGLIGIIIAGPGVDFLGPALILLLAIPFSSLVLLPASAGWLGEACLPSSERGLRVKHFRKQWRYFTCTMVLTVGVMVTMTTGVLRASTKMQAMVAIIVCIVTGGTSMLLLPGTIWRPLMYMFLANMLSISTGGFVDNFYLDPATREESVRTGYPVCVNCPHFSATFYYTVVGMVDSVFMFLGSAVFSKYMATWNYRTALTFSLMLMVGCSLLDIVQYQRWNVDFNIPDWVFMLGKCSVQNTLGMINFLPTTILISKICPEGMEASVFALLAGFSNFGTIIAGYLGAFALTLLGMDHIGRGEEDDFSQAWKAAFIGALSPLVSLALLPFLIPNRSMADDIVLEDNDGGGSPEEVRLLTNGSLLFDVEEYR